jgi:hypothetical protein
MSISSTSTTTPADHRIRVMRWMFRRGDDALVCELGLSRDRDAYELFIDPPRNPVGLSSERFDDAMTALERQAAAERLLVEDGWSLESFESDRTPRD